MNFQEIQKWAKDSSKQIAEIKIICAQIQENNEKIQSALNYMNGKPDEDPLEVSNEVMANDDAGL